MPKVTVADRSIEVPAGKRLVLAIEELGIHIGHRCGGNARCTTCRVEFRTGEPDTMTNAEYDKLQERLFLGKLRLSCQIEVHGDMEVVPQVTLESEPTWTDTGPKPNDRVMPLAEFIPIATLAVTKNA